ncbi:lamin tail domain-containing protein [Silanimonas sp.]|jgi:predicted extracellular nuclease|uniref:lamin tail domain-containing protein n=1 Tax=Silanimonas sp. TaxID=1929290 RepID=UPI0037CABBCE
MRPTRLRPLAALCAAALALSGTAGAQVVISQVYGGGGNSGAPLRNDFIELYNAGPTAVNLSTYSVQYASSTGTAWSRTNLTGTLQPGQYYLVQQAAGTNAAAAALPTPDATGTIAMSGTAGKVALVGTQVTLAGACPGSADGVLDLVGFGTATTCSETAPTANLGNAIAALRKANGCTDTGSNSADFDLAAPAPRNTAVAAAPCSGPAIPVLTIADAGIEEGDATGSTLRFTVTLSAPAPAGGVRFDIATADGSALAGSDYAASATGLVIAAGERSATFDVALTGDTTPEPDETFVVRITNVTGADVGDSEATGTIRNDDIVVVPINAIQGSGSISPLDGQVVVTEGVITARRSNGFFVQTADGEDDGNPGTSEGLFVFTGSTVIPAVAVGNRVRVSGRVVDFTPSSNLNQRPLTEITGGGGVTVQVSLRAAGVALPTPVAVDPALAAPTSALEALERYEGMRVSTGPLVTVAASGAFLSEANATVTGTDGVFHAVLQGVPRPFREPGIAVTDVIAATAPAGVPRFDTNPERIRIDSDAQLGAARVAADAGTVLPSLTGVLDYGSGVYTLLPDPGQLTGDATGLLPGGPTPKPVADAPADAISVASFNLLRFFDNVNDPAIGEPVLTTAAFEARLVDTSEAICRFLKTPDVLGIVEVENLATLQRLADAVNSNVSGACGSNPQYAARLLEGNDVGGIDVGVLVSEREVRPGTPRVTVLDVEQVGKASLFNNPNGDTELLNDRPSLAVRTRIASANGNSAPLTVVVNHLRSLNGVNDNAVGSAGWATSGQRVRAKRAAQALELARWIESRQQADAAERMILVGDFNAFEFSDGLVDSMGVITGREAGPGTVLEYADSPVTRPLTTLTTLIPQADRYSFSFEGNAQSLDHVVANDAVFASALAVVTEHAAINADFSETRFGQSAVRTSDHDPVVVRLIEGAFRTADLGVSIESSDSAATGRPLPIRAVVRNGGPDEAVNARVRLAFDRAVDGTTVRASSGWTCSAFTASATGAEAECRADRFSNGSTATFDVTVPATVLGTPGTLGFRATAEAASADPATANNSAAVTTTIAHPADLAIEVLSSGQNAGKLPVAGFVIASANRGPATAQDVRLEVVFRGPERLLNRVVTAGWNCTRSPLPGNAEGVVIGCRLLYSPRVSILPPVIIQVVPRDAAGPVSVGLEARIAATTPDVVQGNNADEATATVGRRGP